MRNIIYISVFEQSRLHQVTAYAVILVVEHELHKHAALISSLVALCDLHSVVPDVKSSKSLNIQDVFLFC